MSKQALTDRSISEKLVLCLRPLLAALNWHGTERHIKEALPHLAPVKSAGMFAQVMQNLNFTPRSFEMHLTKLDQRLMPCLFISDSGEILVILRCSGDELIVYDSEYEGEMRLHIGSIAEEINKGRIYIFQPSKQRQKREGGVEPGWFRKNFIHNKSITYTAVILSMIINLLALATPLFIMSVYDKVISAASIPMLLQFTLGVLIAMAGVLLLYQLRGQFLALLGSRLDHDIGNTIFERLLYLSPRYTESASVGNQVARLKDFDRLREFFSGPLMVVFFELPYILLALALIAVLGQWLVLVPIIMLVIYLLLILYMHPKAKWNIRQSAVHNTEQQEFILETVNRIRAVKYTAAEQTWLDRYRDVSARSSLASLRLSVISAINNALSEVIMIGSGLMILAFGAIRIINGSLTVGAMLAIMILIWRILGPIRAIYNALPRVQQIIGGFRQIGRLMQIKPESKPSEAASVRRRKFRGEINFSRVSLRYETRYSPALVGVDFKIKPGQLVGVVGGTAAGKSSILKLILGLYAPQAGSVIIDGQDIRQLNPIELRNSIGYLPQNPELFYGTIAANMRMGEPNAGDEELRVAAEQAGILQDILNMPNGFNTRIKDYGSSKFSTGFRQGLCLARAYLKNPSILLLDEPGNMLDFNQDRKLIKTLNEMRGKTTVVMVTHRPSHLKAMDLILVMHQAQLIMGGPPQDVLTKLPWHLL